ncbi:MAG: tryptophan synthase subunit alpha [bacterium]|nr:tryptophan synthase subunit alpha [bacterium]
MRKQIMTHIVAGYPTMKRCRDIALLMSAYVDFIEIQIPFSDPVADGPTIMSANQKALTGGTSVEDCFRLMEELSNKFRRNGVDTKLLFMSYFNILHHMGIDKFCKRAKASGCYGLIVPDIPIDEEKNEGYLSSCGEYDLMPIQIVSPLTTEDRLKKISKHSKGFIYCVSRFGTTGQSTDINRNLKDYLKKVRKYTKLPLAVGFGISKKQHIDIVHQNAEIAVIGSKIINLETSGGLPSIKKFLASL